MPERSDEPRASAPQASSRQADRHPPTRHTGLDALRGLAAILMVEQHLGVWLWRGPSVGEGMSSYTGLVALNALGGAAAPLFITLAGTGSALFAARGSPGSDATCVRRGLMLLAFGTALNLATPSWFSWGSWYVLHLMGLCIALTPLLRHLSTRGLLTLAALVLAAAAGLQTWLETPTELTNERMKDLSLTGGTLRLAAAEGQFPVFPWLALFVLGFVAGHWLLQGEPGLRRLRRWGRGCIALGCALAALGAVPAVAKLPVVARMVELHLGFYPASSAIILLLGGLALSLISTSHVWVTARPLREGHFLVLLGRTSLSLLLFHVVVFREATRPVQVWRGLNAPLTLFTTFAFLTLWWALARGWQRSGFRFGAEWWLRRIAG